MTLEMVTCNQWGSVLCCLGIIWIRLLKKVISRSYWRYAFLLNIWSRKHSYMPVPLKQLDFLLIMSFANLDVFRSFWQTEGHILQEESLRRFAAVAQRTSINFLVPSTLSGCCGEALKNVFVTVFSHFTSTNQNWNQVASYAAFVMDTNKSDTPGYVLFRLVYGRPFIHSILIALSSDGFEKLFDVTEYVGSVRDWLFTASLFRTVES